MLIRSLGITVLTSSLWLSGMASAAMTESQVKNMKSELKLEVQLLDKKIERYRSSGNATALQDSIDEKEIKELQIKQMDRRLKTFTQKKSPIGKLETIVDEAFGKKTSKSTGKPLSWEEYTKKNQTALFEEAIESIRNQGMPQVSAKKAKKSDNVLEQIGRFAVSELLEEDERAWPEALEEFKQTFRGMSITEIPTNSRLWVTKYRIPERTRDGLTSLKPYYTVISQRLQSFIQAEKKAYEGASKK